MGVVRTTFVIDENGIIERVMPKVKPDTNAAEILAML
jgi:peroxiredoxin Q/BCP